MPRVQVQGVGVVEFPDGMSPEQITTAIERDILPRAAVSGKRKAEPAPDPTADMSFADKALAGAGKAFTDIYRGGKQLLGIGDQAELQRTIDEEKRLSAPLMQTGGGVIGNLIGSVAATAVPGGLIAKGAMAIPRVAAAVDAAMTAAPIATATGIGAATGGVQGALEPVATGESRSHNIGVGATIGAAGGLLPGVASRVVKPNTAPEVQQLIDEGVRLTPGQTAGGVLKRIEDAATSIPVVGDVIKRAQTRGIEDFNRAGFNRALAPIGEKVGPDFAVGREGIAAVEAKIGQAYDRALDKIKIVQFDPQFEADIAKVSGMVPELGDVVAKQFDMILKGRVLREMTPAGTMSADTMKAVESELGRQASRWSSSADAAQRGLADALREVQSSLRGAVERSAGPEAAGELQAANEAWANFVRIRDAAARVGSADGVFTPAQLTAATRAQDKSRAKGAFARGDALMQDLAEAAKGVMPSKVPDSGTATRIFTGGGVGALLGHGMGLDPSTMALGAAAMLPYTSLGGKLTMGALARRPESAATLAEILRGGAPAGGIASGLMAPLLAGP